MPLILNFTSGRREVVSGEKLTRWPWLWRRYFRYKTENGHSKLVRVSCVEEIEHFPLEEWEARRKAHEEAQAAATTKNPRPGREPRLVIPR